jgi:hypothetical protein
MSTLSDLALVLLGSPERESEFPVGTSANKLLGAAALYDLADRGRLRFEGIGPRSKVMVADSSPVPEPSLNYALGRATKRRPRRTWKVLDDVALGWGAPRHLFGGLVAEGHLRHWVDERGRPAPMRFVGVDQAHRQRLLSNLNAVMFGSAAPDESLRRLAVIMAVGHGECGLVVNQVADHPAPLPQTTSQERRARGKRIDAACQRARGWVGDDPIALALDLACRKNASPGGYPV